MTDVQVGGDKNPQLVLSLFVTGSTPSSTRARAYLQSWVQEYGSPRVRLEIIDVTERPELAEEERVLATPALIRHRPLPRRKIVGDLSDWETVALSIDLGGVQ